MGRRMARLGRTPAPLSPQDQTLDAPLSSPSFELSPAGAEARCPKVHLAEGSDTSLSSQTQSLLRIRLRAAAIVMFLASGVFFVWGYFGSARDLSGNADL